MLKRSQQTTLYQLIRISKEYKLNTDYSLNNKIECKNYFVLKKYNMRTSIYFWKTNAILKKNISNRFIHENLLNPLY